MSDKYILGGDDGHTAIASNDLMEWAKWFEAAERRVARTECSDSVTVSTVFLGLNHQWDPTLPPLLFETLVFGGPLDGEMDRYSTWDEAERGHAAMCARAESRSDATEHPERASSLTLLGPPLNRQ